jgi:hypothetical protein
VDEPLAPLRHYLPRDIQSGTDGIVRQSLRGKQDDLGSYHVAIRCRIAARPRLKLSTLRWGQLDNEGTLTRHEWTREEDDDDVLQAIPSAQVRHRTFEPFLTN